jgi:tripartite-type tricarboxylate transporter receptor subunit TctC
MVSVGSRRLSSRVLTQAMLVTGGVLTAVSAQAQTRTPPADAAKYPSRVVRLQVGYAAGGAVDVSARVIAQKLTEAFGQSFIVENRPGADGIVASDYVAKSAADGHVLAYISAGHTMNPSLHPKSLPYHPVRDFAPVSMIATGTQTLVVNPALPVKNVKELVTLAKARPGQINFASSGSGGPMHLSGELLKLHAGIDIVHVPYKGGGPALNDVIGGQVEMTFIGAPASMPHIKSGRLRVIAVSSAKRVVALPDVPTVAEAGYPGFDVGALYAVLAPAGTPAAIVNRLNGELAKIVAQRDIRERLNGLGLETVGGTPEQLGGFMAADVDKWIKLVQKIGLKTD